LSITDRLDLVLDCDSADVKRLVLLALVFDGVTAEEEAFFLTSFVLGLDDDEREGAVEVE
jgi:hypothetical protein